MVTEEQRMVSQIEEAKKYMGELSQRTSEELKSIRRQDFRLTGELVGIDNPEAIMTAAMAAMEESKSKGSIAKEAIRLLEGRSPWQILKIATGMSSLDPERAAPEPSALFKTKEETLEILKVLASKLEEGTERKTEEEEKVITDLKEKIDKLKGELKKDAEKSKSKEGAFSQKEKDVIENVKHGLEQSKVTEAYAKTSKKKEGIQHIEEELAQMEAFVLDPQGKMEIGKPESVPATFLKENDLLQKAQECVQNVKDTMQQLKDKIRSEATAMEAKDIDDVIAKNGTTAFQKQALEAIKQSDFTPTEVLVAMLKEEKSAAARFLNGGFTAAAKEKKAQEVPRADPVTIVQVRELLDRAQAIVEKAKEITGSQQELVAKNRAKKIDPADLKKIEDAEALLEKSKEALAVAHEKKPQEVAHPWPLEIKKAGSVLMGCEEIRQAVEELVAGPQKLAEMDSTLVKVGVLADNITQSLNDQLEELKSLSPVVDQKPPAIGEGKGKGGEKVGASGISFRNFAIPQSRNATQAQEQGRGASAPKQQAARGSLLGFDQLGKSAPSFSDLAKQPVGSAPAVAGNAKRSFSDLAKQPEALNFKLGGDQSLAIGSGSPSVSRYSFGRPSSLADAAPKGTEDQSQDNEAAAPLRKRQKR